MLTTAKIFLFGGQTSVVRDICSHNNNFINVSILLKFFSLIDCFLNVGDTHFMCLTQNPMPFGEVFMAGLCHFI